MRLEWRESMGLFLFYFLQAPDLCISLALALHYSRLSVVCWLLAATHDLYRTVKSQCGLVNCPPPTLAASFCKYSLLGWGLPLLFLGLAASIQVCNYLFSYMIIYYIVSVFMGVTLTCLFLTLNFMSILECVMKK